MDGQPIEGRFIAAEAYAAYAEAALLEAHGDVPGALEVFRRAEQLDPQSVEILTRIGAIECRLGQQQSADATFARAERLAKSYAPLWRERSRCALGHGQAETAREFGGRAVALDPTDEDASLLVAKAYEALGDRASAGRYIDGYWAFQAGTPVGRRWRRPKTERAAAEEQLSMLDALLAQGDLVRARSGAKKAGLSAAELAVRAVVNGYSRLGAEQAELVLAADPRDTDAWIAALVAADLAGDQARFTDLMGRLDRESPPPGPLAGWLLAELLARRIGPAAARSWLDAQGRIPASRDALMAQLVSRVKRSIQER
jgi:tetratricopeptide (TPR) repeat protein